MSDGINRLAKLVQTVEARENSQTILQTYKTNCDRFIVAARKFETARKNLENCVPPAKAKLLDAEENEKNLQDHTTKVSVALKSMTAEERKEAESIIEQTHNEIRQAKTTASDTIATCKNAYAVAFEEINDAFCNYDTSANKAESYGLSLPPEDADLSTALDIHYEANEGRLEVLERLVNNDDLIASMSPNVRKIQFQVWSGIYRQIQETYKGDWDSLNRVLGAIKDKTKKFGIYLEDNVLKKNQRSNWEEYVDVWNARLYTTITEEKSRKSYEDQ